MRKRKGIRWMCLFLMLLLCAGCGRQGDTEADKEESTTVEQAADESQGHADAGNETEDEQESEVETGEIEQQQEEEQNKKPEFPILIEEGKLAINSIFQSSIPNPDKDFEEGIDVASIELVNQSEEYLTEADVEIYMKDGTTLTFKITDLPPGKTVWAFDLENTSIPTEYSYQDTVCEAEFEEYLGWENEFQVNCEIATVTVKNLMEQSQESIKIKFHCLMEDIYFGGTSYEYVIERLASEESTELEVFECYFGEAEAVQIKY